MPDPGAAWDASIVKDRALVTNQNDLIRKAFWDGYAAALLLQQCEAVVEQDGWPSAFINGLDLAEVHWAKIKALEAVTAKEVETEG